MPSYCIEVNFEFDITCNECGDELKVIEKVVGGNSVYRVEPCETCLEYERDEAHKKGYEAGEEFGYAAGHIQGYADGQESVEDK